MRQKKPNLHWQTRPRPSDGRRVRAFEAAFLIQRSLDQLTADRTTIAITDRLSAIEDTDTIHVPEEARIVERGDHTELLAKDGLYANLRGVQAGGIEGLPEEFAEWPPADMSATSSR